MSRDETLKTRWELLKQKISELFGDGEILDLDAIIYLIGVQELGQGYREFKKDEKLNLMHIAICRVLEPLGYYEFDFFDVDGWPHYKVKEEIPFLGPDDFGGQQEVFFTTKNNNVNSLTLVNKLNGKFPKEIS